MNFSHRKSLLIESNEREKKSPKSIDKKSYRKLTLEPLSKGSKIVVENHYLKYQIF